MTLILLFFISIRGINVLNNSQYFDSFSFSSWLKNNNKKKINWKDHSCVTLTRPWNSNQLTIRKRTNMCVKKVHIKKCWIPVFNIKKFTKWVVKNWFYHQFIDIDTIRESGKKNSRALKFDARLPEYTKNFNGTFLGCDTELQQKISTIHTIHKTSRSIHTHIGNKKKKKPPRQASKGREQWGIYHS
jgi:hypothetical protein